MKKYISIDGYEYTNCTQKNSTKIFDFYWYKLVKGIKTSDVVIGSIDQYGNIVSIIVGASKHNKDKETLEKDTLNTISKEDALRILDKTIKEQEKDGNSTSTYAGYEISQKFSQDHPDAVFDEGGRLVYMYLVGIVLKAKPEYGESGYKSVRRVRIDANTGEIVYYGK